MTKKLSVPRLRQLLGAATKEQLLEEIVALCARFEVVEKHYQLRLSPEAGGVVLEDYKARVAKAMRPKGYTAEPKVSEARRLISEYKKVSLAPHEVADLQLVYVESGLAFLRDLGDYRESFYDSLENMFANTVTLIQKNGLEALFEARCARLVKQAQGVGYGLEDVLQDLYESVFAV